MAKHLPDAVSVGARPPACGRVRPPTPSRPVQIWEKRSPWCSGLSTPPRSSLNKSLLDLYADYLISSFGPTTAAGLSRLLQARLSQDKVFRFLAGRQGRSANLRQIVKPLVRQVQRAEAVLVIDDSIAHKPPTNPADLTGWHSNHTTSTSVGCSCSVKSINFLTTLYCTDDVSLPVAFALVEKD